MEAIILTFFGKVSERWSPFHRRNWSVDEFLYAGAALSAADQVNFCPWRWTNSPGDQGSVLIFAHDNYGHFIRNIATLCFGNLFWCLKSLASAIHLCHAFNIKRVQIAALHWKKRYFPLKSPIVQKEGQKIRDFMDFTHSVVLSLSDIYKNHLRVKSNKRFLSWLLCNAFEANRFESSQLFFNWANWN